MLLQWNDLWDNSPSDQPYDIYVIASNCDAKYIGRMTNGNNMNVPGVIGDMVEWRYTKTTEDGIQRGNQAGFWYLTTDADSAWVPYFCC